MPKAIRIYKRASARWKAGTWLACRGRDLSEFVREDTRLYKYKGELWLVYAAPLAIPFP